MRWSAEKLRWLALGGALLLAGIVAAFLGLANYRAGRIWQRILKRNGVNLVQESNGITWSQSVKGRTVFTIHAEKSTPHGNGIYSLHNAVLILYGKDGRNDRIHGNEFEYDQNQGMLRAIGEVHMDLQAPAPAGTASHAPTGASLSFNPEDEAAADPAVIHVLTSGLVYLRKLGVAATTEPVEFRYRGLRCTSHGAKFDSEKNELHLLAEVQLAGTLREAPFTLAASRADLDRGADTIDLVSPDWTSGERRARADHSLLHLQKDGSLQTADGDGHVLLSEGARTLGAPQAHVQFAAANRPERTVFTGGVQFADGTPAQTVHGTAAGLTLTTDARGALDRALAEGEVRLHADLLPPTDLPRRKGSGGPASTTATATRDLRAERVLAGFVPEAAGKSSRLQSLHMTGTVQVTADAAGGASGAHAARTSVAADDLLTTFTPASGSTPTPQHMAGLGHTVLTQNGADGARQVSEGDTLDAQFAQRLEAGAGSERFGTEVSTAVQTGHVVLHAWPAAKAPAQGVEPNGVEASSRGQAGGEVRAAGPSVGHAERAVYEGAAGTLTLSASGGARAELDDGTTQLQAPEIALHQGTGDGEASGGVAATTVGQGGAPATHVLAARAKLLHSAAVADFYGTDSEPAQLWQATSQVSAARLVLDSRRHTLTARPETVGGLVHGVFATEHAGGAKAASDAGAVASVGMPSGAPPVRASPAGAKAGALRNSPDSRSLASQRHTEASGDAVRVAAEALDYSDPDHEATFHGHVVLHNVDGTLSGERGVAFLQGAVAGGNGAAGEPVPRPSPGGLGATPGMGGRLERFVLLGDVRLMQPGRVGEGQQLTYTAATDRYVLTGAPGALPRVVDTQQGTVTGTALAFGAADRSVVVASTPGGETLPAGKGLAPKRVHTETDIKR